MSRVVKLVIELHHKRCRKVKFMVELHHGSPKEREANVGASPYRLPHLCEPVSGQLPSESQNERGITD